MAVAYVDGSTYTNASTVSDYPCPTPTAGGALQVGDLLVFSVAIGSADSTTVTCAPPSGVSTFIPLTMAASASAPTTTTMEMVLFYKFVTSADVATSSWDFVLSTASQGSVVCARFRGVDTADPFGDSLHTSEYSLQIQSTASTSKASPAVQAVKDNALAIAGMSMRSGSATLTATPSTMTIGPSTVGAGGGRGAVIAYANASLLTGAQAPIENWTTSSQAIGFAWQTTLNPGAVVAAPAWSGTVATSGSGALTVTGAPGAAGASASTGSGALALAGSPAVPGSVLLSGAGTQTRAGSSVLQGASGPSGSGVLALSGIATPAGAVTLAGGGALTLSGVATGGAPSLGFAGSGVLGLAGKAAASGPRALSGAGALSLTGVAAAAGSVALSGSGSLNRITPLAATGSGTLALTGQVAVAGFLGLADDNGLAFVGVSDQPEILVYAGELTNVTFGYLDLRGVASISARLFRPPTQTLRVSGGGIARFIKIQVAQSVLKTGAFYRTVTDPSDEEIAAADIAYLGGRDYLVDQNEAFALEQAGFSTFSLTADDAAPVPGGGTDPTPTPTPVGAGTYPGATTFPGSTTYPMGAQ